MKKIISIILAAVMLLGAGVISAFAADGAAVKVADVSAVPGGTAEVKISVVSEQGIKTLSLLDFTYDKAVLTLDESQSGWLIDGKIKDVDFDNNISIITFESNKALNEAVFKLVFSVNAGATDSDIAVSLNAIATRMQGSGENKLNVSIDSGIVSVKKPHVHTAAAAVKENERAASCTAEGSYDEVVYCSECKAELSRKTVPVAKKGHDKIYHSAVAPTCTNGGNEAYETCSRCSYTTYKALPVDKNAHKWDSGKETKPATYFETGIKTYTCTLCSGTKEETIPVIAHTHAPATAVVENKKDATCTADGSFEEAVYCSVCKTELSRKRVIVNKLGHDTISHPAVAPTCTKGGNEAYETCSRCSYTTYKALSVDKNAHKWDSGKETKPATYFETGIKTYTCTLCSGTREETIPVIAHTHAPAKAVVENKKDATCTADGSYEEAVYCTVCKAELSRKTVKVDKLGHDKKSHPAVAPTCTKGGNEAYETCSRCSYTTYKALSVDKNAHKWDSGKETKPATYFETGIKTYTCTLCSGTREETIPVIAHTHAPAKAVVENKKDATCTADGSYEEAVYCTVCKAELSRKTVKVDKLGHDKKSHPAVAPTCTKGGNEAYETCSRCSYTTYKALSVDKNAHKWDGGKITTAATCVKEGIKTYTCQNDKKHTKTESVPADAKNHVNTKKVAATEPTYEKPGFTEGVYCNDCKKYISGHKEIPVKQKEFTDSSNAKKEDDKIVVKTGFTPAQLLKQASSGAVITDKSGNSVTSAALGTGMKLTFNDGKTAVIVLKGDIDGNGTINAADARLALRASVKLESFDSAQTKAADIDGKTGVAAADARLILRASVKLENPADWF